MTSLLQRLYINTNGSGCHQYTNAQDRCLALISDRDQCLCHRASGSYFCPNHRNRVDYLTTAYHQAEDGYRLNHAIIDLGSNSYVRTLQLHECSEILDFLYNEVNRRLESALIYFDDRTWGRFQARQRAGHRTAIHLRELAIDQLSRMCERGYF
jgi:hypothetical protein